MASLEDYSALARQWAVMLRALGMVDMCVYPRLDFVQVTVWRPQCRILTILLWGVYRNALAVRPTQQVYSITSTNLCFF